MWNPLSCNLTAKAIFPTNIPFYEPFSLKCMVIFSYFVVFAFKHMNYGFGGGDRGCSDHMHLQKFCTVNCVKLPLLYFSYFSQTNTCIARFQKVGSGPRGLQKMLTIDGEKHSYTISQYKCDISYQHLWTIFTKMY